jgi:hypothetical protein
MAIHFDPSAIPIRPKALQDVEIVHEGAGRCRNKFEEGNRLVEKVADQVFVDVLAKRGISSDGI